MSEVTIRRGTASDAELLAELGARTFTEAFGADNRPEDLESHLAATYGAAQQGAELADPRSTILIAEIERTAVGYAMLYVREPPGGIAGDEPIELARLYVIREQLGRGAGEALMRACLDEARGAGHRTIWLGVWERNPRAIRFYRRWEFREVGTHVFHVGADPQNDIVMSRAL